MNQLANFSYDPAKCSLATSLFKALQTIEPAIPAELTVVDFFKTLEQPPEKALGDYALPCFRFAKAIKKNPNEVATELKRLLDEEKNPWVESIVLKGAFLNIFTNQKEVAKALVPTLVNGSGFNILKSNPDHNKTKVMIEFSQPNTHKEFHVGHGRNVCLGDSICRIFTYNGYKVIGANYIGDEGTHIAKCLWGVEHYTGTDKIEEQTNKAEWLGQRYVEANNKLKDAEAADKENGTTIFETYKAEVGTILKAIESKSGKYYETWKVTRQYCLDDFNRIYKWLDVKFDHFFYESEVSEASQAIVDEYMKKGLFVVDNGAVGFDMTDKKLGFFMARKSNGTTPYITKDLALAKVKFNDFDIDRSIYVVGSEQNFHFKQLFYALEKMGFPQASQCYHLSYGMVVRPDGKMSSRSGNSFTFFQLIDLVVAEINTYLEKYSTEWSKEQREDTAHKLAVGAIKYGMLQADPNKEIVFDPKEWVSFEGNSGPYLMYSYARTQSILRKATEQGLKGSLEHLDLLTHESERDLMRHLYDFNKVTINACDNYRPSTIANHLFFTCKAYNRFYTEVSVMKAETEDLRAARLSLLQAFGDTLKTGLYLLGITPPEKM
ncbi:arginine--tRNA ligase [Bacteriovorax sp. PP10]|uniref:Arginine--tRNA ligase n=1 Tax=Bacteriovorax antarcticus TaxID=3088717 RepID=A0ABU5VQR8_9BACT|nr:arginine--tRNA ligase [Bacteriovorax sp. PP10]MEA9355383.1 arginine--tRNA ligase [Bacteriovorax sp. PP10]